MEAVIQKQIERDATDACQKYYSYHGSALLKESDDEIWVFVDFLGYHNRDAIVNLLLDRKYYSNAHRTDDPNQSASR